MTPFTEGFDNTVLFFWTGLHWFTLDWVTLVYNGQGYTGFLDSGTE